ncbi:phosphotransferase [Paenibacillus timonensis]|uniref:phosphotransferase n=1 Tax=Paenibacillus timonensis TaxID=225915 RepID=UPI003F9BE5AC
MPLNDNQLFEILRDQNDFEVLDIRRTENITRGRASLNKIDVHTRDNRIVPLLEKNTISTSVPYENIIYNYYSNKDVSIPKVFYNAYDQAQHEGILLMEDLTPTHCNIADWEAPIEPNKLKTIIDVISQFHAVSWGRGELSAPQHLQSTEEYLKHLGYLERDYIHFRKTQTYNLGDDQFEVYEKSLQNLRENAQKHIERITNNQHTSLIHGDLNVCNMLYPLIGHARPYIIDLEAVRVGLCTEDLVMLFIHDLYHGGEETLHIFQMYYRSICSKIPCEYTYDQFIEDIRTSIMEGIFFPLKLFVHNGVKDEELILKSLNAYQSLIGVIRGSA